MNDKEIKDWARISVWTLRFMVALGFIVAYLIIVICFIFTSERPEYQILNTPIPSRA